MASYIATHRAMSFDRISPLIDLAESLLGHPISGGVTIRNVAVIPRSGCLHVHADAPSPLLICRLFTACGLAPVSIMEAGPDAWGRLVGATSLGDVHRHDSAGSGSGAALVAV